MIAHNRVSHVESTIYSLLLSTWPKQASWLGVLLSLESLDYQQARRNQAAAAAAATVLMMLDVPLM